MSARRVAITLLAAASCGAEGASVPGDGGYCYLAVEVLTVDPVVGEPLLARAVVTGRFGVIDVTWTVLDPSGNPIGVTERNADGTEIELTPDDPGPFSIAAVASGSGLDPCSDERTVNVRPLDAPSAMFRLRFVAPSSPTAPPPQHGDVVTVYSGANWSFGTWRLTAGKSLGGTLAGPGGPLSAYLSLRSSESYATEFFADGGGAYTARVLDRPGRTYQLIVVPYDASIAPARFTDLVDSDLAGGLVLDAGTPIAGRAIDASGAGVDGATIALGAPDAPAAVGTAASDGSFAIPARTGPIAIVAIPPALSALPRLRIPAFVPAPGESIEIRWNATPVATFSAATIDAGGAPLPGARVTFVGDPVPSAASIAVGPSVTDVASAPRVSIVSDAAGQLASISLPHGRYDVFVEAEGVPLGISSIDLTTGPPGAPIAFASGALVDHAVEIVGPGGLGVAGATVTAIAIAMEGVGGGSAVERSTGEQGTALLPIVPAMTYTLIVTPPRGAPLATSRVPSIAGSAIWNVSLVDAVFLDGIVEYPSGAVGAGIKVEAYCVSCPAGQSEAFPVAETVTGPGGEFRLALPTPGP